MSAKKSTLRGQFALGVVKYFLEHIVIPGRDDMPPQGVQLLDKRGLVWQVEGDGLRRLGDGSPRWWSWHSYQAARIGPLIDADRRRRA